MRVAYVRVSAEDQNETTKMFSFVEFAQKNLCGFCKPHTKCMDMIEYQMKVLLYSLWNSLPPTANKRKGADTENTETSILPNIAQTIGESTEYSNVGTKRSAVAGSDQYRVTFGMGYNEPL